MKYIKEYTNFKENELESYTNDTSSVKKSKEKLNIVKNNIDEYNRVKNKLDLIYKNSEDDDEISKKVDELVGKDKENRNPFIVSYLTVCNHERRLRKLIDSISKDEMAKNKLKEMMNIATDNNQKQKINKSIDEINNRLDKKKSDISKLKLDIQKKKKDIELKMKDIIKNIQHDLNNVTKSQK
jgi:hypothetical protein